MLPVTVKFSCVPSLLPRVKVCVAGVVPPACVVKTAGVIGDTTNTEAALTVRVTGITRGLLTAAAPVSALDATIEIVPAQFPRRALAD